MRERLVWKLLSINIPVIGAVILMVWLAIDYLAADYFMFLMERYRISPTEVQGMFLDAVHRYLIWASLGALVLAAGLGFLLTRKVLRPLSQMTEVSRQIAAGDYGARVRVASQDEIGRLGNAFNDMADSLERVELMRKRIVADVAHELRTPLTNMRGYLEGLRDGVVPVDAKILDILQNESMRMVKLVEDLLELARADAAKAHLRREEVSVNELLAQVLELTGTQFRARNIEIERDFSKLDLHLKADRDKLLQALRNLTDNACKYTPRGGHVRVRSERVADGILVTFANTGEGIAEQDLPHIFERFYRTEKSRSRDLGGAGIGLSIVKHLVEAHGGRVGAESPPGETRIWLLLPT